ncbi:hypothetical protein ACFHWD_12610 [Clostridium sp. MT-14]|uniref:Uncharacterized protein n=1 Tax=Clostridium aromativorans TaxID=2836848 RepID=A0ABS8N8Q6_9CLOT|nr:MULTISPECIES: hypothetical protein [Clostridium]KAA8664626.1 hypothetical protein F3O63_17545 [Clostridium sp. HV4-5-A1G]MCC9296026.1 hypothetical protein [Clostridium aromativorans]
MIMLKELVKTPLRKRKKGDITHVLGIVAVTVIMIAIVMAVKGLTWADLVTLIDDFVTGPLWKHVTDPFN